MSEELPFLSPAEARVLGCLIEKKELTPDVYPLTANALLSAANQKTAREPVMALEQVDITRALSTLQQKGLIRQQFASRVERYEHLMAQTMSLSLAQTAIVGLLLLRGPQTAYELLARAERMARFSSIDDVRETLDMLIGRKPALVKEIGRAPGQREDRFAHLMSGDVEVSAFVAAALTPRPASDLEMRLQQLEERVVALEEKLSALGG